MAEEVIKECEFYLPLSEKCNEILDSNGNEIYKCSSRQDCYYKQLKRLEQENKELKEKLDKEEYNVCCECTNIQNQNDTYRSALEEIREIAKFNRFYNPEDLLINGYIGQIQDLKMTEIYNKINEVIGE